MIEFLRHTLGLCGENHGLLYWIVTGSVIVILTPYNYIKDMYYKIKERINHGN
jgi:hypothetical protein